MPRLSMNEMTTFRWSFEEDVQHYRDAGIPAIGVWRQKLTDFGKERGIELLRESGLAVSNLMWAGGFTGSDGHTHRESIDDGLEAIRLTAALKSPCLVVYSGSRGGHTVNHARRLLITALKELSPVAQEFGVKLALEPMHTACSQEWTFLNGLDDTLNMLEQVGGGCVRLVFDTYHFGWQPEVLTQISRVGAANWRGASGRRQAAKRFGTDSQPPGRRRGSAGGDCGRYFRPPGTTEIMTWSCWGPTWSTPTIFN